MGMPDVIVCVQGLDTLTGKALFEARKRIQLHAESELFVGVKIVDVSNFFQLGRTLANSSAHNISWRSIRSYMATEGVEVLQDESNNDNVTLQMKGYLRGMPMNVNSLMYIPGCGPCAIESVREANESFPGRKQVISSADGTEEFIELFSDVEKYVNHVRAI